MVTQGAVVAAVHPHPAGAVTARVREVARYGKESERGATVKLHPAANAASTRKRGRARPFRASVIERPVDFNRDSS
jgi:hypothetical protein